MTLLVFGRTGQVALELQARSPDAIFLGREQADLTDPDACAAMIHKYAPSAVINAAAYTAVDRAEEDEATTLAVNGIAPGAMAQVCAELGVPFVHISTDYVFAGDGDTPWTPNDAVSPPNAYGRTKLAGEDRVRAAGGAYAILRTSWVVSAHGNNFVKTMLRLGAERDKLTIVADQIGGPTPAGAIAEACLSIADQLCAQPDRAGTYHFSGAPDTSWADFAREIFAQSGTECEVEDIPTTAFPTPATRPLNSRLDCTTTQQVFGIARPKWRDGLSAILTQLGART
ncbi:dTDP-4-dehydrorhamnose reductase [Aliiroseovarius pelagivivens]|uniref:dTDP-4-dehydrorhamnose reductase n=1 Tax=Aliiroseovarius pelagivivens TaxID=1639690 RepID=A0A2R8ASP6_9RHOB|nr:dTDP-4-dehydrorhamnose reductase [Aliiroseovarius pelagivivens]SPF78897.1 dTDP-4-dehydrorhamnose reductase [Aliiroseovarius pelagivivens]